MTAKQMETLGQRLLLLRKRSKKNNRHLTQKDVGDFVGVSGATVSQWESDIMSPSAQNALSLTKLFRVTLSYLVEGGECVSVDTLSPDEIALIERYRQSIEKKRILELARDFSIWASEQGKELNLKSFVNDFGYSGDDKESTFVLVERILKSFDVAL